ncbi:hypothetical protein CPC197_1053A, partial [Chlamydia psittaci C1/97]
MVTTETYDNIG